MPRLAVISNPKSQRNRQGALDGLKAVLANHPDVLHEELRDFSELGAKIERVVADGVEVIAVNGGDGTVQAVLTELARRRPAAGMVPKLAVLAGGMTNVIAKDVGLDGKPAKALERLIAGLSAPGSAGDIASLTRPLIGLVLDPEKPPVYGMFFGAAGFYQAVRLANDKVRTRGVAGSLASASTLMLSLFRLLFGRSGSDDPLYRGEPMAIGVDGKRGEERPYLILIATTLDRLILGLRPFWGGGDPAIGDGRAIRYTSVEFPPKRLARALLPVLRGRPAGWMLDEGYRSGSANDMVIDIKSPVVLDGEIFHPTPGVPVRLTGDRTQTFLTGREARRPLLVLREAVGEELERDCHPSATALAEAMRARHGATVAAVLFYGSCLRQDPSDEPPEGIQDFYVIVDDYRDAYRSRWQAFVNRLLPPNVFYIEQSWQGRTVRAKYAVVSRAQFQKGTSSATFHPSLWARFSQPVALLYARDADVRTEMATVVAEAVSTMLRASAPLVTSPVEPAELWQEALRQTYRAELRPEGGERAAAIYKADAERYERMARLVFSDQLQDDGRIEIQATAAETDRARRSWLARRLIGKPLSVLRLMKSLITFDGGVDYALWKIERHTGVRVPISNFERRHPFLSAPRLLWRVFRLSAVR